MKIKFCNPLGKTGPPDHFGPILTDLVKALIFRSIPNISNPGEGWSTLLAFPPTA